MKTFDGILDEIGGMGRYQILAIFLLALIEIPSAFHNINYVYIGAKQDHFCAPSAELSAFNLTKDELRNYTIPYEVKDGTREYMKCGQFRRNYSSIGKNDVQLWLDEYIKENYTQPDDLPIEECSGWLYDTSIYQTTIISEWDLVCNDRVLGPTTQSIYMAGRLFGSIICGYLSDRYGRKIMVFVTLVTHLVIAIGSAYSPNYIVFAISRFLIAFLFSGLVTALTIWILEIVGKKWRVTAAIMFFNGFAVGQMVLGGIGYGVRTWRGVQLASSCPMAIFLVYMFIFPESPRWLFSKGRVKDGIKVVETMAKVNGVKLEKSLEQEMSLLDTKADPLEDDVTEKPEHLIHEPKLTDLFLTKYLRRSTLIFSFVWFATAFVYYGLSLNTGNIGGDPYINQIISGCMDILGNTLVIFITMKIGRRLPMVGFLFVAGVALLLISAVPKDRKSLEYVIIAFAMTGKLAIAAAFNIVWIYTPEAYPTFLRAYATGTGSAVARIGSTIAPYVLLLGGATNKSVPMVLFGAVSALAGVATLWLPETRDSDLLETIDDAETLNSQQYRKMHFRRCCKRTTESKEGQVDA